MSKKRHPEHVNHERWLVSYADFITLLFAFFVVMFASAPKDDKNLRKITTVPQTALSKMSIFGPGGDTLLRENQMRAEDEGAPPIDRKIDKKGKYFQKVAYHGLEHAKNLTTSDENFKPGQGMRDQMTQDFFKDVKQNGVLVAMEARGLVISFREVAFFDSGSAELTAESEALIDKVMAMVKDRKNMIQVEGHSDSDPLDKGAHETLPEMSTERAAKVANLLIKKYDIAPEQVSTAAFGPFRPIDDGSTDAGRSRNRRVDLVLLQTVPDVKNIAVPQFIKEDNDPNVATEGIIN